MIARLNNFLDSAWRVSARLRDAAVSTLYPSLCQVCGDVIESWRDGVACSACWREIEQDDFRANCQKCHKCWTPLPFASNVEAGARACGRCDHFAFAFVRS